MKREIYFSPHWQQPMIADMTMFLEKNPVFDNKEKEKVKKKWIEDELANLKWMNAYSFEAVRGVLMRGIFLGVFLEKSLDAKQCCYLDESKIKAKQALERIKEKT